MHIFDIPSNCITGESASNIVNELYKTKYNDNEITYSIVMCLYHRASRNETNRSAYFTVEFSMVPNFPVVEDRGKTFVEQGVGHG